MEKIINAMKARQNLGTVLNEVFLKNDQFIIERNGKPQAAVIPIWQFEQWKEKRRVFFEMIQRLRKANRNTHPKALQKDIEEAVTFAKKFEIKVKTKSKDK
jgi:prevent-host-death family protein